MNRTKPERWPGALLLVLGLLLAEGCATQQIWTAASQGQLEHYLFEPVERAYQTPSGDLVLCVEGLLPGRRQSGRYTVLVPRAEYRRAAVDCGYRGHLTIAGRLTLSPDWPTSAQTQQAHWQTLPTRTVDRDRALGDQADSFRNQLPALPENKAVLYTVRGYGAGDGLELTLVCQPPAGVSLTRQSFTLQPLTRRETRQLVGLPMALVGDGVTVLGYTTLTAVCVVMAPRAWLLYGGEH